LIIISPFLLDQNFFFCIMFPGCQQFSIIIITFSFFLSWSFSRLPHHHILDYYVRSYLQYLFIFLYY
jgi:hypothetical protein